MPTRRMFLASGGSPILGDCAAAGAASDYGKEAEHAIRVSSGFTGVPPRRSLFVEKA